MLLFLLGFSSFLPSPDPFIGDHQLCEIFACFFCIYHILSQPLVYCLNVTRYEPLPCLDLPDYYYSLCVSSERGRFGLRPPLL